MKRSKSRSATASVWSARRRFLAGSLAAAAGAFSAKPAAAQIEQTDTSSLRILIWPQYIGGSTLKDFRALTGITVTEDTYESSSEMLAIMKSGEVNYDIVIAAYDFIEEMIQDRLLLRLDHDKLPNIRNIHPFFRDDFFDPGRRFTVPFLWGTQGLCYRKSAVNGTLESWKVILDSDEYSGRIALPGVDTVGLALKYLGYSYNSNAPEELEAAGELLMRQKANVKALVDPEGVELLAKGEVDIAVGWNTDALRLMDDDEDIDYRVPVEGGLLWEDCVCIPRSAANPEGAFRLMNFAMDGRTAALIAEELWYATPNRLALDLMPKAYMLDPAIFPGYDIIKRCEPALNLGPEGTQQRDELWEKVLNS